MSVQVQVPAVAAPAAYRADTVEEYPDCSVPLIQQKLEMVPEEEQ